MTNRQRAVGSGLHYHVVVSDGAKCTTDLRLPDGQEIDYPSISSTLIHGRRDAVLVDPPLTRAQTAQVAAEIEGSGVRLLHVYLTHGHPDHWFGTATLLERFGDADTKVYAGKGTIAQVAEQLGASDNELTRAFPGQIPERISVSIEPVPADGLTLEGHLLLSVDTGHTDTDDTTVLHVPSLGLVVAGDVVHNGVHQMLAEGGHGGLRAWLDGIDRIEALAPRFVVAGHKNKHLPDDPRILDESRQYLQDAIHWLGHQPTPAEFYREMMRLHRDRLTPGVLWRSALAVLG